MDRTKDQMDSNKVFGQGGKAGESDKLNIDSIIARLLEGKQNFLFKTVSTGPCYCIIKVFFFNYRGINAISRAQKI